MFPAGVIVFGSDQEVGELMRAIDRNNMTGYFTWIGSDGWGGRVLVSDGNEAQVKFPTVESQKSADKCC